MNVLNGKKWAASVQLPVVGGSIIGAVANRNTREDYQQLKKPSFSPPGWVFPVVWTGLYTAMGIAKYRASVRKPTTALPYNIQLGLNFLWSFLFFRWGLRGTAFVEIALMLGAITWTTYEFYQADAVAGTLMMPYAAWIAFALGLNYSIWSLNRVHS